MRRVRRVELIGGLVGAALVAGGGAVALASPAWAAGAPSNAAPPSQPLSTSTFGPVVSTVTIQPAGGTYNVTLPSGATVSFSVPAGDFTVPVQVELTEGSPSSIGALAGSGSSSVVAFGISLVANGSPVGGVFKSPVSFVFKSSSIKAGDLLYEQTSTGAWVQVTSATVTNGEVQATIDSDPNFDVVQPATTTAVPVPYATTPTTGVPVAGELLLAGGLVVAGGVGLLRLRATRETVKGS
jgi:hypothetical protein